MSDGLEARFDKVDLEGALGNVVILWKTFKYEEIIVNILSLGNRSETGSGQSLACHGQKTLH
jgi:hypothetical protein